jgi:hypothetical protein
MTRGGWVDWLWWLAFAGGSTVWCVTAGDHLGPTVDETLYVQQGLERLHTGNSKRFMADGVMTLPPDVQALPAVMVEQFRGERFDPDADFPQLLRLARYGSLAFWWLLLAYSRLWGRRLGGPWGGRWAVALVACEPNLLGHAALATTDIAATATILMATFRFATARDRRWWRRVLVPGVLWGVALSAKASALVYVPLVWLVLGMHHLREQGGWPGWVGGVFATLNAWRRATFRLRWDLFTAFWIAFGWVLIYTGTGWQPEPQFSKWANSLEPGPLHDVMTWLADRGLACFPNAAEGLARQIKHGSAGHGSPPVVYGQTFGGPVWFYFPASLLIKLPDATLLAVLVLALVRPRGVWHAGGWVTLALLLFSLTTKVQIGLRLVFPVVVFLLVTLASGAVREVATPDRWRRRIATAAVVLAVVYAAVSAVLVWPDGIRHVNRLHGGPDRGAELLSDSNHDWGQGLPELREWWATHGEPPLHVWYFGFDPACHHPPFINLAIHTLSDRSPAEVRRRVGSGYLAVSTTLLHVTPDRRPETDETRRWLRSLTPVARTRTMYIYRFEGE